MIDGEKRSRPRPRILYGVEEPIFSVLPERVLANLYTSASENALLWNLIYPLTKPFISLNTLYSIPPLWGTAELDLPDDDLEPYFWGFNIDGQKLTGLEKVLNNIDGDGPQTEVDLFLLGNSNLLLVEGKHLSGFGRCSRFSKERCPEIHNNDEDPSRVCRYWEPGDQEFRTLLNFGSLPQAGDPSPLCNRHYQLARTLLVGAALADKQHRDLHLWLMVSHTRWRQLERSWLDFANCVIEECLWRRLRVIAWEDIQKLPSE